MRTGDRGHGNVILRMMDLNKWHSIIEKLLEIEESAQISSPENRKCLSFKGPCMVVPASLGNGYSCVGPLDLS